MSAMSRNKGARGERELAAILREELGTDIVRNLVQTRDGGSDLLGVDGWAIESKRAQKATRALLMAWWVQTEMQALAEGAKPVLAFREDRGPWEALIRLCDIEPDLAAWVGMAWTARISLSAWCALVRSEIKPCSEPNAATAGRPATLPLPGAGVAI